MSHRKILGKNKKIEFIRRAGVLAFVFLGAFAVAFLSVSNFAPASDSSATDIRVAYDAAGSHLSLSSLGTINFQLSAGMSKVEKDTLTIGTNSRVGYKVYISSPEASDSGDFVMNSRGKKKTVARTDGTVDKPAKLAANTWGYAPSRSNDQAESREITDDDAKPNTGSEVMIGMPAYEDANTLYVNSDPLEEDNNAVDIYYGVSIDNATVAGRYSTSILYTAVNNPEDEDNEISIAPASQKSLVAGQAVTVSTALYPSSVDNLGAVTVKIGDGDCTDVVPKLTDAGNLNIECKAPAQAKSGAYDVTVTVENYHKTFVAKEVYEYVFESLGVMQDFECFSLDIDEGLNLRDTRDNHIYRVKRLRDGNCWMLDDLVISGPRTLTPEDTDLPSGSSFTLYESDQSNWCYENSAECYDQSKHIDDTSDGGTVYYNWYTATAGTFPYKKAKETDTYPIGGTASGSICPKGWKLPSGMDNGYNGAFTGLTLAYSGKTSGYVSEGDSAAGGNPAEFKVYTHANHNRVEDGIYWSGTASSDEAYHIYYWPAGTYNDVETFSNAGNRDWGRDFGYAVRCVAAEAMDRFSCSDIPKIGGTKELLDFRNGTVYTIVKAKDGKCWTASNQNLIVRDDAEYDSINFYHLNNENSVYLKKSRKDWCLPDAESCSLYDTDYAYNSRNNTYGTYYGFTFWKNYYYGNNKDAKVMESTFCPNHWHTPTKEEWQTLYDSYGSVSELLKSPLNLGLSGYHLGSEDLDIGKAGYFWTASYEDDDNAYAFHISKNSYGIDKYSNRYGFSLRCIAPE